jgi:hypothetical protein
MPVLDSHLNVIIEFLAHIRQSQSSKDMTRANLKRAER